MSISSKFDMDLINETLKNLEKNNMKPFYCETSAESLELVKSLLREGDTVTCGGSRTLKQTGIFELLKSGSYNFLNRETMENPEDAYIGAFTADAYLMSTNALLKSGVIYNVDGNSNRVAALLYGPKSVIVVCGYNKICESLEEAVCRVKKIAAPLNTQRLHTGAYCEHSGECVSLSKEGSEMCDGCASAGRVCCNYVVTARQRKKDRIKVIIVGEELGF